MDTVDMAQRPLTARHTLEEAVYRAKPGGVCVGPMAQGACDESLMRWGLEPGSVGRGDEGALTQRLDQQRPTRLAQASVADRTRMAWVVGAGKDETGVWSTLQVGDSIQRFRWIPAGGFSMGCNKPEAVRAFEAVEGQMRGDLLQISLFEDATPSHHVLITRGFWLADTVCTQAMWQGVMGRNPSRFTGDDRLPVEQVSWEDCREFLGRVNRMVVGLHAVFPSEAQWEYACRAGSPWVRGGEDGNPNRIPAGNSASLIAGVGNGAGRCPRTSVVAALEPNAWGLYDMQGNVHQWCSDWYGDYDISVTRDPAGPPSGAVHVHRGGLADTSFGKERPASRGRFIPGMGWSNLGFRMCVPGQVAP